MCYGVNLFREISGVYYFWNEAVRNEKCYVYVFISHEWHKLICDILIFIMGVHVSNLVDERFLTSL